MHARTRGLAWIALAMVVVSTAGCAVGNRDRRILLSYLDENWTPGSTAGKWLASPATLPVGFVAGLADAFVIHPSTQFDDAWGDTVEFLWTPGDQTPFRRVVMAPVSALATPFVFAGDWLVRAVFDVSDREEG